MTPRPKQRSSQEHTQVASVLGPELFHTVDGIAAQMSAAQGRTVSRAEVLRDLAEQGVAALRAAARAQDVGGDPDLAAVHAASMSAVDTALVGHVLDMLNDILERTAERSWRDAVDLSHRAAVGLAVWSRRLAAEHGETTDRVDAELAERLAAQEALADQLLGRA